ncbi:MAG: efflux RND transporter permease subunit, partial [Burkholderiales bacterium]|nr:efflux RND transporter permease subunit [Burkholderiales bacterium]
MGISGRIARYFVDSQLTPLVALVAALLGVFAVLVTPREEEPQINVTMANVVIPFPGASAKDVEELVATPAEQVLSQITGIEHVYSVSKPGLAVLTVQYKVGENRTDALVRLYDTILSNRDWLSPNLGVGEPLIKPMGIDDVPIVALTLWTDDPERGAYDLERIAHAAEVELKRVPGTRVVQSIGGPGRSVRVLLDPERMQAYKVTSGDIRQALIAANASMPSGALVGGNRETLIETGGFLASAKDVARVIVGTSQAKPVFLEDVAKVVDGPNLPGRYVRHGTGGGAAKPAANAHAPAMSRGEVPAVTIAISKKPGENAVDVAERLIKRVEELKGSVIPEGVGVALTRNYGETANDKAQKLIQKLVFATLSVVALVWLALGRREAVIVGVAVLLTLAATLFASWAWGFTLNRVSLFALIFSIGILVDDAIVVVENIHRHQMLSSEPLAKMIPGAVDEVGGPTILATFTVIAALLPMAFVSGLMGPYMSPIPINASIGMVISLAIAFIVTPWLAAKLLAKHRPHAAHTAEGESPRLERLFTRAITPFLRRKAGGRARWMLFAAIVALILGSVSLAAVRLVVLKMLPFDNKSEFQVVLDMPNGTALEETARVLGEMGDYLATIPEVVDYQIYAGTAAPINFNGLVRQYYLRQSSELGDIQVNLVDKHARDRQSHEIAAAARPELVRIAQKYGATVKVVEVPPGPPVLSPIVAEVYGPDYAGQQDVAQAMRKVFGETADIVDVDSSVE